MVEEFEKGDEVEWSSHGGTASGEVEKKITTRTKAADRAVAALQDDPQYLVKSTKSGGKAVHKPSALRRKSRP
jgi:Hypervirulence associated proteins TUDOR domain